MTAHSQYSASASARWLACPGSLSLSADAPRTSSAAARRGTAAHEVAAELLEGPDDVDPRDSEGREVEVEGDTIVIDEDLTYQITQYVGYVRGFTGMRLVEVKSLYAAALGLEDNEAWGTADAVVLAPDGTLHVMDLKTGRSWVGATGNTQLALYAAGVVETLKAIGMDDEVKRLVLHIVQPAVHTVPDTWELTVDEFAAEVEKLRAGAAEADEAKFGFTGLDDEAWNERFLRPSDEACQWCPAASFCPRLRQVVDDSMPSSEVERDSLHGLDVDELNEAMQAVPLLETWIAAVQAETNRRASLGEKGLAFKLVLGREGNRKWSDDDERIAQVLRDLPESLLWAKPKLQSPAQLEKAMKKLKLPTDRIEGLVVRNPARPTLVPVDDPRPQWIEGDIANEFDKIS